MNNIIIDFFKQQNQTLIFLKSDKKINSVIYYYKYVNYKSINKLNLIIKSLKAFLNHDIIASFEEGFLKIEVLHQTNKIIYFENYLKAIPKNQNYIFFGVNTENKPVYKKLNKIKSLLIGGSSGSGKSILLHDIILSILLLNKDIYIYLIDLKMVEFSKYESIKRNTNRIIKIVTLKKEVLKCIIEFYYLIISRYKKMKRAGVRNCTENAAVLIIDEYAQLFNTTKEKRIINDYISKIGALGRACNCFLILATQHPTNENISNTIRANLQSRIALKCRSKNQSYNIIESTEATSLKNPGDALLWLDGEEPQKIKTPFISDTLLNKIIDTNK